MLQSDSGNFAIILGAGASKRMGTCKALLLSTNGQTLLSYQAEQFILAGITPLIVLAPHNIDCQKGCPSESQIVINSAPERGKSSSVITGLQHLPSTVSNVVISAVDQPRPAEVYRRLLENHIKFAALITAPKFGNCTGHPLFFASQLLPELQQIREETLGVRQIVQKYRSAINRVEFQTSDVMWDLNTPESYERFYRQDYRRTNDCLSGR